jgi:predicted dienelactone hydrolase
MNLRRSLASSCVVLVVLASFLTACEQKGPAPTEASIEATTGPFAIATTTVGSGNGFGGATIYAPTDTSQGSFGGVAIAPGFTETQSQISWLGPRLATQGFVVMTIDTNSTTENPTARAQELLAALTYLTSKSSVAGEVDAGRLAVMGHSMGGGAALEASSMNHSLKAAIPLAGWDTTTSFTGNVTPTLVVGCQNDNIAPPANFSTPFYNSLNVDKAYLEIAGGSHLCPTSPETSIAKYSISWLKRFVDDDTRYEQFLCPTPAAGGDVSKYLSNCPYS